MKTNTKMDVIETEIYNTIDKLGLPTDFNIELKPFSMYYVGRYNPNNSKVIVYYLDEDKTIIDMDYLMENVIHEVIHHYQWKHDDNFTRIKGVMHNQEFKYLEDKYLRRYKKLRKRGDINVSIIKKRLVEVNDYIN